MKKDLRYFIVQYKVKKLYRDFVKEIYKCKNIEARKDLMEHVKSQFETNRNIESTEKIEYLIAVGRQQMTYLKSMIDMQS